MLSRVGFLLVAQFVGRPMHIGCFAWHFPSPFGMRLLSWATICKRIVPPPLVSKRIMTCLNRVGCFVNSVGEGEGFTSSTFNVVRWLMTTTTKQIGIKRQEKLKFVSKIQEERSIRVIDEIWCCSSNHRTYLYIQGGWTGSWRLDRQGYSLIRVLRLVCCPSLNQKVKTRSLITVSVTSSFIAHYTPISQGRRCNGVAERRDESFLIISTLNRVVPLFFPKTASPFRLVNVAANSPFLFFFFLPLTSSMSFASLHHWNPPDVPFSFIILQLFP